MTVGRLWWLSLALLMAALLCAHYWTARSFWATFASAVTSTLLGVAAMSAARGAGWVDRGR